MKKDMKEYIGIGRRKTAVASVRMRSGEGQIEVNGKKMDEYFVLELQRQKVLAPLQKFSLHDKYDLVITAKGGGIEAQVEAARLGVSRALVESDETFKTELKAAGFLTRDPRKKERKKYGRAGARKRFQFSKR